MTPRTVREGKKRTGREKYAASHAQGKDWEKAQIREKRGRGPDEASPREDTAPDGRSGGSALRVIIP